jgi:hypothetical protein
MMKAGKWHENRRPRSAHMAGRIRMALEFLLRSSATDSVDYFESKIDGDFHGWSGRTPFALANGQIWQQSAYGLVRHHADSPRVVIYRSGATIKMKVDGVDQPISIKRIK